ncbi:MAG: hypothetical protein ABIJ92_03215 [Candidatus Aenigmatarchaeota archaeon]
MIKKISPKKLSSIADKIRSSVDDIKGKPQIEQHFVSYPEHTNVYFELKDIKSKAKKLERAANKRSAVLEKLTEELKKSRKSRKSVIDNGGTKQGRVDRKASAR